MAFDKVKYDNAYAKNNYDRIPINVPKGKKELIERHCKSKGYKSINAYVNELIDRDMEESDKILIAKK